MSAIVISRADAPSTAAAPVRIVRAGLLGLGNVGQAVARLAGGAPRVRHAGVQFRLLAALVRDVEKPRRCLRPPRVTTNISAFLRGNYDVVFEALGTVEPARGIVARLLGRGVAVITANKALVAAHGRELSALAERRGTRFRYEASALAAVPFLGALAARPLVSDVQQFVAVVNGTSNFILDELEHGSTFDAALARAGELGLTEPDPSRDLDGLDAADKLALLSSIIGWGAVPASRLERQGIRGITREDLASARALGCTIKPIIHASDTDAGLRAFVGPVLVPLRHPLAALSGASSGIHLSGRYVPDLFFSGPGAGPDVTAATMLDDAVEAIASAPAQARQGVPVPRAARLAAPPSTEWFVRLQFPGMVPDEGTTEGLLRSHDLQALRVTDAIADTRWAQLGLASAEHVHTAVERLRSTHRINGAALRKL